MCVSKTVLMKWALILIMFGISGYTWVQLPADAEVIIHWDVYGNPNGNLSGILGLLIMPVLGMIFSHVLSTDSELQTHSRQNHNSGRLNQVLLLLLVLLTSEIVIAASALGYGINPVTYISSVLGVYLFVVGANLQSVSFGLLIGRKNRFRIDHPLSEGREKMIVQCSFMLGGLGMILFACLASNQVRLVGLIACSGGLPLVATIYAFVNSKLKM